jgi:hypothetical protein
MTISPLESGIRRVHLALLWGASLLVPRWRRSQWVNEWRTELWYVLRECSCKASARPRSVRKATAFCLGAYRDAIWLRRQSWQKQQPLSRAPGSAPVCFLLLIGALLFAWGVAHMSSRVAAGMSRIQVYPRQVADTGAPCDCPLDLAVGRASFEAARLLFDGFSHYEITQETVWSEKVPRSIWTVAQARADFFDVLQLPVFTDGVARVPDSLPHVVLSQDTWIRNFGRKPNIEGAKLHIGSVDAIVVGVTSGDSMGFPGTAKAWLLGPDPQIASSNLKFVVGHLSRAGYLDDGRWALSVGGILLGLLVLPFVSRPSIGEYGSGSQKPSLARRGQFWAFLFAKITISSAIVFYASVDLGCLLVPPFSPSSAYIQATSSVTLCLLGLGWAFRDQQRRCPICLRRMAHPVEVGQPSQTFLGWNGTELVCERGHTLLHIPGTRTSWFGSQRWVCLDGSWEFLFARSSGTSSLL